MCNQLQACLAHLHLLSAVLHALEIFLLHAVCFVLGCSSPQTRPGVQV
jgi:hypothetical protein